MRTSALPVTEGRFRNSNERVIGNNGEINAGSRKEILNRFVELASMIANGELINEDGDVVDKRKAKAERANVIREAFEDSKEWAELGSAIAYDVDTRLEREGFMRTILNRGDIVEGAIPRIRVKERYVTSIVSRGIAQVYPQYVRDRYVLAEEFYVTATPRVEIIELHQGSGDILEERYFQGLEQIFVGEDRTLLKMLRAADGIYNDITYFSGTFSQTTLQSVKQKVDSWRIPATTTLIAIDLLSDVNAGTNFSTWFDPISKWEIVKTGRIGNLLGMSLVTDGYREPNLRVLDDGEFIITGSPEFIGGYTDRGPVNSIPVDEMDKSIPARGWTMREVISMTVANAKAVARGKRS